MKSFFVLVSIIAMSLTVPAPASAAWQSYTIGDVNMRTGPGVRYRVKAVVPRGASVRVRHCRNSWCSIEWRRLRGWLSRRLLASAAANFHDDYVEEYYDDDPYYDEPIYRTRRVYRSRVYVSRKAKRHVRKKNRRIVRRNVRRKVSRKVRRKINRKVRRSVRHTIRLSSRSRVKSSKRRRASGSRKRGKRCKRFPCRR